VTSPNFRVRFSASITPSSSLVNGEYPAFSYINTYHWKKASSAIFARLSLNFLVRKVSVMDAGFHRSGQSACGDVTWCRGQGWDRIPDLIISFPVWLFDPVLRAWLGEFCVHHITVWRKGVMSRS
jgi:hypothetical protein